MKSVAILNDTSRFHHGCAAVMQAIFGLVTVTLLTGCGGSASKGFAPVNYRGGSNFNWYAGACQTTPVGDSVWWQQFNTIKHFDEPRTINQLSAMYAHGQRSLRLGIFWVGKGFTSGMFGSQVRLENDNSLPDWYEDNYIRTIEIAQSIGFERFIVSNHPVGDRPAMQWRAEWNHEIVKMLDKVIARLPAETEFYVDLLNESLQEDENREPLKLLWEKVHRRPWGNRAFIGMMGGEKFYRSGVRNAEYVYEGKPPSFLGVNLYDETDYGEVVLSLHRQVARVPIIVGETHFNSEQNASRMAYELEQTDGEIHFVTQWPLSNGEHCGRHVDTLPVIEFDHWIKHGF